MTNREATEKFQLSQKFYEEGRYPEALNVLNELGNAFPGMKNILYPRALCLYKLDRLDEARYVCELLTDTYSDSRAATLLEKVKAKQVPPPAFSAANLAETLARPQAPPAPPAFQQGPPPPPPGYQLFQQAPAQQPPPVPQDIMFNVGPVADPMGLSTPGQAPDPLGLGGPSPLDDILGTGGVPPMINMNDDLFGVPARPASPIPPPKPESNARKILIWTLCGVCALVVVTFLALPLFTKGSQSQKAEAPQPTAEAPASDAGDGSSQAATPPADLEITWQKYDEWADGAFEDEVMRPTVLYFYAADSEDCKKMDKVFEEPSIIALTQGWRFVKVDFNEKPASQTPPAEMGEFDYEEMSPVEMYSVQSAPTVVVLSTWGGEVYRQEGVKLTRDVYAALQELNLQVETVEEALDIPAFPVAATLIFLFVLLIAPIFWLYVALLLTSKLPTNEIHKDLLHITGTMFVAYLICLIPCVGWIIAGYFISTRYEMGFVDMLIFIGLDVSTSCIVWFIFLVSIGVPPRESFEIVRSTFL